MSTCLDGFSTIMATAILFHFVMSIRLIATKIGAVHPYCPPTKFRGGNVFSYVCLSVCLGQGVPIWGPSLHTIQGPQAAAPNMFKLVQLLPHHTGTPFHTLGHVRILPQCKCIQCDHNG